MRPNERFGIMFRVSIDTFIEYYGKKTSIIQSIR